MNKISMFSLIIIFLISQPFFCATGFAQQESVTLTTYYPSPYGSYNEMRARKIAVGDNYINSASYPISSGTSLIVEGNVGIGTSSPAGKLTISAPAGDGIRMEAPGQTIRGIWITSANNFRLGNWLTGEGLTIDASGRLGVGTTSPSTRLEVVGLGGTNVDFIVNGRMSSNNNDGGLWTGYPNKFVGGRGSDNSIGFYNNSWYLNVYNNGSVVMPGAVTTGNLTTAGTVTTGDIVMNPGATINKTGGGGRLHITSDENIYLLPKAGTAFVSSAWGGAGNLEVSGTVYAGGGIVPHDCVWRSTGWDITMSLVFIECQGNEYVAGIDVNWSNILGLLYQVKCCK